MTDHQTITPLFGDKGGPSWREQNARLFRTDPSFRWFVRQHMAELVAEGALIRVAGRWHAVEPNMTRAVLEIGQQQARRRVAA